jgi:hypothetical protein
MKLLTLIKMCFNEMYSKVLMGKCLFDNFPSKTGSALSPLPFNFALENAMPGKAGGTEIK